ncbi:MAG: ATP-dependent DNA helicase RecG [Lachnospiraceae bacterium]|nr:ATP-dependent DNA helicase RecG [Lachnospiraceae bacterium]
MKEDLSISALKGIGEKTALVWERLGVKTLRDLIYYFPRDYLFFPPLTPVSDIIPGGDCAAYLTVERDGSLSFFAGRSILRASAGDETGTVQLSWFNMPYLKKNIRRGLKKVFYARASAKGTAIILNQPKMYSEEEYRALIGVPQGIYPLSKGLTGKGVVKAVRSAFKALGDIADPLDESVRASKGLMGLNEALHAVHFPESKEQLFRAGKRLAFDEFMLFLLSVRLLKEEGTHTDNDFDITETGDMLRIKERLPYRLTKAQERTLREVMEDLKGTKAMNRLVQGDVGSGKTIVAFLALIAAASNGFQGALMAPTEVLAAQHAAKMNALLKDNSLPYRAVLLTGSLPAGERRVAREEIRSGKAAIVIGTHALIQEGVEFKNLALVVTDEQHRFGVGQREKLGAKSASGKTPHVLVMSATPIPRTLAIILYGDLDVSVMDEKPSNRLPVKNAVVDPRYRKKAWELMEKEALKGHQSYVICPQVEPSEMTGLMNVGDYCSDLRSYYADRVRVGFLHGQMKPAEKNSVMDSFASGEIQILVSTTVVEVGVDVPNATVMVVENAERFGLAALHQLRGRIGRGEDQSYCVFINTSDDSENKRLEILKQSNDGFEIASQDLKLRGPGDMFGIRQSGLLQFNMADIYRDADMLKAAADYVGSLSLSEVETLVGTGFKEAVL